MIKHVLLDFWGVLYIGGQLNQPLLDQVRALVQDYRFSIMTSMSRSRLQEILPPHDQALFDHLFAADQLAASKSHPEAYTVICSQLVLAPSTVLFIDDSHANLQAASAAGLVAHEYDDRLGLAELVRLR